MIVSFEVRTRRRSEFVDITDRVQSVIQESGVDEGTCIVFVPHTTAAVTINENADPDVIRDIDGHLAKVIPADPGFRHGEGNSDAHIKSSLLGQSETLLVKDGRALLGTWQGVFFAEFDGPRTRHVHVRVSRDG